MNDPEQLPLDFSSAVRNRRWRQQQDAMKEVAEQEENQTFLFEPAPNIDVSLYSSTEAVAQTSGAFPEADMHYLQKIVGALRPAGRRRAYFPARRLDRLVCVKPPANITLDAAALAVGRALWAHAHDWRPLVVANEGTRLVAGSSRRWPGWFSMKDVPWPAVQSLLLMRVPLDVDPKARRLLRSHLARAGTSIARAALVGTAVRFDTDHPHLLEDLDLPALAYDGPPDLGRFRMPLLAATGLLDEPSVELTPELRKALQDTRKRVRPITNPDCLPFDLHAFQKRDVAKLIRILKITGGGLLAAEMGSGKTIMAIATAETLGIWPALIVSPLSAFSSWERELAGCGKTAYIATDSVDESWARMQEEQFDAIVVSYDRLHAFVDLIEHLGLTTVIADEVQRIRTPSSRRSRAMRRLAGAFQYRIGLSGTPMQNKLTDILPIGAFLQPGEWKPRANTRDLADLYAAEDPVRAASEHLGAMMVRRRKEEVGVKLVDKTTSRVRVELSRQQKAAIREIEEEAKRAKERGELEEHMHVFAKLQKIRAIQDCPSTVGVEGEDTKLESALEIIEDYTSERGKMVVFTSSRSAWQSFADGLDEIGIGWVGINGSTPPQERIAVEKRFIDPANDHLKVVLATIQSTSEGVSFSKAATGMLVHSGVYDMGMTLQMEARVHRLDSIGDVDIIYVHSNWEGGSTLDDRIEEIFKQKRALFARVVDNEEWESNEVKSSLDDLLYMLTGERD